MCVCVCVCVCGHALCYLNPKVNWCTNKSEAKYSIPQLRTANLAQTGRHQSGSQMFLGSIPTLGNVFAEFILLYPT